MVDGLGDWVPGGVDLSISSHSSLSELKISRLWSSCNTNMMNESASKTGKVTMYLFDWCGKKRKERHFVGRVPGPSLILCVERGLPSLVRLQSRPSSVSERMWRSVGPVDTHEIRPKWWPNNWPNFLLKKKDANKFSVCFVLMGRVRLAGCGSGASLWLPALLLLLLLTVGVLVGTFALFYRVSSHLFST